MKKLIAGLGALMVGLAPAAWAQPSQLWENWGQIIVPSTNTPYAPQIDAITFINHRGATFQISGTSPYTTSRTLNYTNQGVMTGFPGFDFQTFPPAMGQPEMAANFANLAGGPGAGEINCFGTIFYGGVGGQFFGSLAGNGKILVRATNIVNSGNFNMSATSLLGLAGKNIDLSRGGLNMDNTSGNQFFGTNILGPLNPLFNAGILDGYWAAETATNAFNPFFFQSVFPSTPFHWVTNRQNYISFPFLYGQVAYVNDSGAVASNRFVQAVFLYNSNPDFVNSVYFSPFEIAVEWRWLTQDWPDTSVVTNYFYVTDNFGEVTNIGVRVNGYINPQAYYPTPTYSPVNYQFYQGAPYNLINNIPPATPGMLPNVFENAPVTNQYAAYQAIFTAGTALPTDVAGGAYSNMPGRIEIRADNSLNLYRSRISTLNYLRLEATNHFRGSQNAAIKTPYADYNLRSTNGSMSISNIIAPYIAHPAGTCSLWSGRWTNVVNSVTNSYHVLFVESLLEPLTYPEIANLKLAVTNVPSGPRDLVINDVLKVTTAMELNAETLTIAANDASAFAPFGELNLYTYDVVWPNSAPGLQALTNWGVIGMRNAVYFGGNRTQPAYNGQPDIPYRAFVNHGAITNQGSIIWSEYFENNGILDAGYGGYGYGSIILQKSLNAVLGGGTLSAPLGQVSLYASSISASNTFIEAGGPLELAPTNSLSDGGGLFSANFWTTSGGFSLLSKPDQGDLLATTVYSTAANYEEPVNYWAGEDRGNSTAGFLNNGAVGQLILTGGRDSAFRFVGPGAANALYVDVIELRGSITNRDDYGNFPGLSIDPNIRIYFADAIANGASIAEKLDGRNDGRLVWVSSYAGNYSSTNILYPDGNIYSFNRALVQSCNLDSDEDGIANCSDATPCLVPGNIRLSISITNEPPGARLITWPTLPNSTNYLYYKTSSAGNDWQLLTNFVFGPSLGKAAVLDAETAFSRYYRVRVEEGQR